MIPVTNTTSKYGRLDGGLLIAGLMVVASGEHVDCNALLADSIIPVLVPGLSWFLSPQFVKNSAEILTATWLVFVVITVHAVLFLQFPFWITIKSDWLAPKLNRVGKNF